MIPLGAGDVERTRFAVSRGASDVTGFAKSELAWASPSFGKS